MINNNLFLTLIIYFLIVCLSVILVTLSGHVYLSFVPLVLAFIFTLLIVTRIDKSITDMTTVLTNASRGDFSGRYKAKMDWEIEPLGLAINDLIENVAHLFNDFTADREDLKFILGNLSEALWIQNKEGILIWTSRGFDLLFTSFKRGGGQRYWEVIHEPALLDYVKTSIVSDTTAVREIELGGSAYLCKGIFNAKTDTHVFILQNIDLLKQTEQMKKDFMINLAHELRTPLTAIKGFSEALSENPEEDSQRYLKIIRNHTERLINLVSDLQTLASLERMPELNLQPLNLLTFFSNIKALYHHTLEERKLYLNLEYSDYLPKLTADPFKLEQIFINLIDNALRYTEQGGITIRIAQEDSFFKIEVCDTGRGIEPEHRSRIFERFYVADPSRNRAQSGTGLGLAIVKHAVMLHHGSIQVQSETGKGTCFTMLFPLLSDKQ